MESQRKRIRRYYKPLTTMANLVCSTPLSPVTQVYNSDIRQYEPDRPLSPTVVHPNVVANASDGSWRTPQANALLANMKWFVNGVDITTLSEWSGLYEIDLVGSTRGDITIRKNLEPGSYLELSFEADIADTRLGVNVHVKCDPIVLSTVDKSDDDYSMALGDDQIIVYDPFKDKLHVYEYKTSHGLATASAAELAASTDENSYLRTIPVHLYKGAAAVLPANFTVKLYQITGITGGTAQLSELTTTNADEVEAVTSSEVSIDLRLVEKKDYLLRAFVNNAVVAEKQFSVNRAYPKFTIRPTNGTGINPGDTERYDVAMVDCDGTTVDCPECIIKIIWKTDTAAYTDVTQGEGGDIVFQLSNTGIGNTYLDDWLDVYCEGTQKESHSVAINEDGAELTDENGDTLIFN